MNHLGATARIRLGIDGVKRFWKIYKTNKYSDISTKVKLLSDGGDNVWNCVNCHLEETSLKTKFIQTQAGHDYMLRIRSAPIEEDISFSKERGMLTTHTFMKY